MGTSKIEWTDATWNPITGCTKVSEGCRHCYAERMARRLAGRHGYPEQPHHFDVTLRPDRLDEPLRWRKPRMVFVCSMSDLFHEDVPFEFIKKVYGVMDASRRSPKYSIHTYQILTKRAGRMFEYCQWLGIEQSHIVEIGVLSNVWLGVSIENQTTADARREYLRQCPAAVKFVSYEPALGPIDWAGWEFVDQIISGGESGPGARPSHPNWHRATRDFCQEHNIAYFFKQHGQFIHTSQMLPGVHYTEGQGPTRDHFVRCASKHAAGRLLDGREHNETPSHKGDET